MERPPPPCDVLGCLGVFVENTPWKNTRQDSPFLLMEIREVLALNLKALRQARGISQEELAHRADLDRTYVSSLERRIYAASIDVVDRLAKVLEVDAYELLKKPTQRQQDRESKQ